MAKKPAPAAKPETKNQRANRIDSAYTSICGASYSTPIALGVHVANCPACQAVPL